jgi:transcription-repair coupling factor (superfamily II helicase)
MAMAGIRKMSLITTAPPNRSNVLTTVSEYRDDQIREAIERELARDGRVFVVVPRIVDIGEIRAKLKISMPDLEYYVIHGRMNSEESGRIMNEFYDGLRKVLIATTIVENGIDIPLANTLIVYRANNFGLAQLYQLRGRIGRDRVQGFAYLMTKKGETITDSARRKLEIIGAIDTLGAGFVISSRDMEIRGAGNILGESQTGHMKDVGVELYNNMLEESIENHRRRQADPDTSPEFDFYPEVKLGIQSIIPSNYIDNVNIRIKFYRKIAAIKDAGDKRGVEEELEREYGKNIPESIYNLINISLIKTRCKRLNVQKLVFRDGEIFVSFYKNVFGNPDKLIDYIARQKNNVKLNQDGLLFYYDPNLSVIENAEWVISILEKLAKN